ncbi:MAG: hypothetical protein HQL32_09810, partial [Planctomycetes bacterium]|nr:hypothetical protein [Planctomycetota bacterium]
MSSPLKTNSVVSFDGVPQGPLQADDEDPWEVILRIIDRGTHSELQPLLVRDKNELSLNDVSFFILAYPRGFYSGP